MSKYTPGPWHKKRDTWRVLAGSRPVADVNNYNEDADANTRLIVASPALYEAAKLVEDWWLTQGMNHFDGAPAAIFSIRAALAKAEGK